MLHVKVSVVGMILPKDIWIKNIDIKVNPIKSNEFKCKAQRPLYSVLDNFMLKLIGLNSFRNWEESIEEYLERYDMNEE